MKKILLVLVLACIFACASITVCATEHTGECGADAVWSFEEGVLTISGTGSMKNYATDNTPWKNLKNQVKEVVIEEGITSIGSYAFADCKNLEKITIPQSVKSIGNCAFLQCDNLKNVYIKDLTRWCNISFELYSNPLYYGANLYLDGCLVTSLVIPETVSSIGQHCFMNCTSITSVEIPISVKSIGHYAFSGCSSLEKVTIANEVTNIGHFIFEDTAFYNNAENWENGLLYAGKYLINAKNTLEGVVCVKDGTLTIAQSAFSYANVESVIVPASVTKIPNYAFSDCSNLKNVIFPSTITEIGYDAIYQCKAFERIYYMGSESEWGKISFKGYTNTFFKETEICYDYEFPIESANDVKIGYSVFSFIPVNAEKDDVVALLVTKDGISTAFVQNYAGTGAVTFTIENGFDSVKIMAWDSYESMESLMEYATIE